MDVYLFETETYQPDVFIILNTSIIDKNRINGVPNFVIEILFLSTAYYDLRHKKKIYEESGVKEYWILDPIEKSLEIYSLKEKKLSYSPNTNKAISQNPY